ncbi:MAG: UDP-N-acetylglucosamine 1-carboxyvinyltransferase [Actinomycetia bacterium]|nr:UDP-N-acetylglucosamine 1-carboxyvinyltransferase [Actinomycetes bacterium]MCP4223772.1 UDP-N-acetylglucosamine 1-carboxyvinyltransferase [Actinomycetes bacterium]MCP5032930.1 UDP-N-acetylglucosamine 1-carboxyvinyltransferase [Actinomycetes bacterium]
MNAAAADTAVETTPAWVVSPVGPLTGDIVVRGSKNAVTKHLVASMLGDSPSTITNCPDIGDVDITSQMLQALGCGVERDDGIAAIDPSSLASSRVPLTFSGMNRIPILMVGPLLHKLGEAFVPLVGGDDIGSRPVDFHVTALKAMGADITFTSEGLEAKASRLRGGHIELPYPSVGATETVLLSATLAEGRTVLDNGALEPEVIELALFLQRMGARIELRPNRRYIIDGVDKLSGAAHRLQGDRIEAFSYLVAGLVTGGQVTVYGCSQDRLVTAISTLSGMGAEFDITDTSVSARADKLVPAAVETDTHPGFMTDWQSPMVALFTRCEGLSVMYETVYENRFTYVPALNKMGAQIETYNTPLGSIAGRFVGSPTPCSVIVRGGTPLKGTEVVVPDIRGGFAYVLAAASAEGTTTITGTHHLDRGYNRPIENFKSLGLDIERVQVPKPADLV